MEFNVVQPTDLPVSLRRLRAQESGCRHHIVRRPNFVELSYWSADSFQGTINCHRSYLSQRLLNITCALCCPQAPPGPCQYLTQPLPLVLEVCIFRFVHNGKSLLLLHQSHTSIGVEPIYDRLPLYLSPLRVGHLSWDSEFSIT